MSLVFNKDFTPLLGNTYAVKDRLKAEGCRWEPKDKTWYAPVAKAELLKKFVRWGTEDLGLIEELEAEESRAKNDADDFDRKEVESRLAARHELKEKLEMSDAQADQLFNLVVPHYWEYEQAGKVRYASTEKKQMVEDILKKHKLI